MKSNLQTELKLRIREGRLPFHSRMTCTYCERMLEPPGIPHPLEATKDHPHPKTRGGGGYTVWACKTCNSLKADMSYDAWKLFMEMHPQWWGVDFDSLRDVRRALINNSKEEEDNIVPLPQRKKMTDFKLITGGSSTTGNWLMDMDIGARFTVMQKSEMRNFMGLDLQMIHKTPKTCMLYECSTGMPFGGNGRVVPERFVQQFSLVEILPTIDEIIDNLPNQIENDLNENMESNHGERDRTDSPDAK